MRYLLILCSMLIVALMLCGGCRVTANTPGYEQAVLQSQIDALYAEIGAIEDQMRDANAQGDQARIDELQHQRNDLMNQLSALIGKPTTDGETFLRSGDGG